MEPVQVPVLPNGQPADDSRAAATEMVNSLAAKFFGGQQPPALQPAQPPAQQPAQPPAQQPGTLPPTQPPAQSAPQPAPAPQPAQPVTPPQPAPPPVPVPVTDRYAERAPALDLTVPDIPPERTDIALPQDGDQSAVGRAFAASRAEARQYRNIAEQLKAKLLEAGKVRDASSGKVAELTKELTAAQDRTKALENEIGKLDLQRSPEFVEKYDRPIAAVRDQLAEQFVKQGMTPEDAGRLALDVIDAPSSDEVQRLTSELQPAVQGMAMYKYAEVDNLFAARDKALAEWRETQAGLNQVSSREAPVLDAERRRALCDTGFDRVSKIVRFWDDPAFVEWRSAQADSVRAWFSQAPEEQVVAAAVEGALVAPFAYEQIAQLQQQLAQAQHALEARARVAAPPVAPYFASVPVAPPPAPPAAPQPQEDQDPMSYARSLIGSTAQRYGVSVPQ